MVNYDQAIQDQTFNATLLLQVHDELIFELPRDEVEEFSKFIEDIMDNALSLDVPLLVETSYGDTWYDAK